MHEDRNVDWSEITVIRLKSAKQARPSQLIRILALRPHELVKVRGGFKHLPL